MKNRPLLLVIILSLLLSACQADTAPIPPGLLTPEPTATAAIQDATATPVIAGEVEATPTPHPTAIPPAARTAEPPLRFTFPTPGAQPVSLWRPPLYPAPWALSPFDHFFFIRPIGADEVNWPEPDYRYGGIFPGTTDVVHSGIDIDARPGTPVIAVAAGRVIWVGFGLSKGAEDINDPYGNAVALEHEIGFAGQRLSTVYAHMDRVDVEMGQRVELGTQLGVVGNTGLTTGPHLHFEIRLLKGLYYTTRNPELWLTPPQGWGVLVGRMVQNNTIPIFSLPVYVRNKKTDKTWEVHTYGPKNVKTDEVYQENMVLSDLPAGDYEVTFTWSGKDKLLDVTIRPGAVTYFYFRDGQVFSVTQPSIASPEEFLATPTKTR